jgi:hypothetical protein
MAFWSGACLLPNRSASGDFHWVQNFPRAATVGEVQRTQLVPTYILQWIVRGAGNKS